MKNKTVTLPLDKAVDLAVKENFERDVRLGLNPKQDELPTYKEEATYLLTSTGQNYNPAFLDHSVIRLEGFTEAST